MMDRAQKKKLYLTSLMVSVVATAIGSGAMGVMLSSIIDAYDLQTAQEGYMSSCISAGALAALLGGILLRGRVSKPAFIFWGGTLMSVMLLLKGTAIPFGVFLAVCTAMGLGMGVMDSFQSAFLADLIPERSARGLGVLHGIFIEGCAVRVVDKGHEFHKQALPAHAQLLAQVLAGQVVVLRVGVDPPGALFPEEIIEKGESCLIGIAHPLVILI